MGGREWILHYAQSTNSLPNLIASCIYCIVIIPLCLCSHMLLALCVEHCVDDRVHACRKTLILTTGELCFEPVAFNQCRQEGLDLMGGLRLLSALSAYRDPYIPSPPLPHPTTARPWVTSEHST